MGNFPLLGAHNVYAIPAGTAFGREADACHLIYSPLANLFFLARPEETLQMEKALEEGATTPELTRLLDQTAFPDRGTEVSTDTFCTLHLLLNEKCNFHCKYCYSAGGRSTAELTMDLIRPVLDFFLSADRRAARDRTLMFMGGGEPVLSWPLLEEAAAYAEETARTQGIALHLALTTNGSILTDDILRFLKEHRFTVQVSFEVLPDVQEEQRGNYDRVAANLVRLTEAGVDNYVRSTVTAANVDRIPQMVEHCHRHFPLVRKLSCQQVVDASYFTSVEVVDSFFDRYFHSFRQASELAAGYGMELHSSSSHLLNYSRRERFCYNLMCLTPYGTLTTCPDVSSPSEPDYAGAVIGRVDGNVVNFDPGAFARVTGGTIHTLPMCRDCYARWNCGGGCPSSRRVYSGEIFAAICAHYRRMLRHSLLEELAARYARATGGDLYRDMAEKL